VTCDAEVEKLRRSGLVVNRDEPHRDEVH
jgi:hypothetical protein